MVSLWKFYHKVTAMALQGFLSFIATTALFLLFYGMGSFFLRKTHVRFDDPLLHFCISIGLGLGAIGNAIMAACFFQLAHPLIIRLALASLFVAVVPEIRRQKNELIGIGKSLLSLIKSSGFLVGSGLIVLVVGYLCLGLLPPTDFDGLMYHLAVVKLWLAHGGFFSVYFNPQADFPMLTEMIYMIGLAFGNDIICKSISFGLGIVLLCAIALVCKTYCGNKRLAVPAVLVFLTFTNTIANMSDCNVDIAQALWTLLAVFCLDLFIESHKRRYALCTGFFAGMAMQTKIFGIFVLVILFVQGIMAWKGSVDRKKILQGLVIIGSIAVFCGLPWYVKSFLNKATILSMNSDVLIEHDFNSPLGIETHNTFIFLLINTVGRVVSSFWSFTLFLRQHRADSFGPLLLVILPFACFVKIPRKVKTLFVCAVAYFASVLVMEMAFLQSGSSIRYSTFVMVVAAPLIAWTISQLSEYPRLKKMLQTMVVVMVLLGTALFAKRYHHEWKAIATNMSRDAYMASVLPEYSVIQAVNSLKDNAVVMPIYNFSNYLIDVPYITAYRNYATVQELKKDFQEKNIRYIFANNTLDTSANANAFPQIDNKKCIASANGFYLFKVCLDDF